MKTDDLINVLAQDARIPGPSLTARIAMALAGGGAVALVLFLLTLGTRPDIGAAMHTWRFVTKIAVAFTCFAGALWAANRLARPETCTRDVMAGLLAAPALLATAVAIELLSVPPVQWYARAIGTNSRVCLVAIPLLSLAPLAGLFAALRAGAPRSPVAAGAAGGLLAGGLAATLYAVHCPDDSPLFVAIWYALAIAIVALASAWIGGRILRW